MQVGSTVRKDLKKLIDEEESALRSKAVSKVFPGAFDDMIEEEMNKYKK